MKLVIRPENECDFAQVEALTRDAFWDVYKPGCDEHLLAHKLRKVPAFVPELDFVAVLDNQIVGNIMYSKAKIIDQNEHAHEVLTFGPVSVMPSLQKKGIGSALILHTKKLAMELGYTAVIIFGNPAYYHRFGFVSAEKFAISTADGASFDAFMALELTGGALRGISGRFYEDPVFHTDPDELEAFERQFPYKKKHVTDTQLK